MEQLDLKSPKGDPTEGPARCFRGKHHKRSLQWYRSRTVSGLPWSAKGKSDGGRRLGSIAPAVSQLPACRAKGETTEENGGNRFEVASGLDEAELTGRRNAQILNDLRVDFRVAAAMSALPPVMSPFSELASPRP